MSEFSYFDTSFLLSSTALLIYFDIIELDLEGLT